MSQKQRSREDGAVAVMTALMVLLMLSVGAIAIDLGNAFTRKRDTQSQADFATLAGAGVDLGLPAASTTTSATDPAIVAAAKYLYENQPQNDSTAARRSAAELASDLVDHDRANGEAYYGDFGSANPMSPWTGVLAPSPDVNELTIITPPQMVKFGLASAMGYKSTNVQAAATAKAASPAGSAVMPMFAVNGCDYGPQKLTEPANGQQVNPLPTLDFPTATAGNNEAGISGITAPAVVSPNTMPQIAVNDTSTATFQISGRKLTQTTYVGFFRDTSIYPDAPTHLSYALNNTNFPGYNINNGSGQFTFPIASLPAAVRATQGVWYVRLSQSTPVAPATEPTTQWSNGPSDTPVPFLVGSLTLSCSTIASDGNFGSLKIPRDGESPSSWLPNNIANGFKLPLTLGVRPGATVASGPSECFPSSNQSTTSPSPVVYSGTTGSGTSLAKTNCVDTDTGLTSNDVTSGLLGSSAPVGRLVKNSGKTSTAPYNPGHTCDFDGTSTSKTFTSGPKTYGPYNNDILTCFMTDPNMPLSTIGTGSYTGPPALSEAIYSSPRFFWVPVFGVKPSNGGSRHYTVLEMRPAFLTDQPMSATRANNQGCADVSGSCLTVNGIGFKNGAANRLNVFFFNIKALPNILGNAPSSDYFGVGPHVPVLTY